MEITRNKFVTLSYVLRLQGFEGEIVEETTEDKPLEFIFGTGRMLQMFEEKLDGLKAGDDFSFKLSADEAYGQVNEEAKVDIPKNIFEVDGKIDEDLIKVGNMVPMQDAQGNRLNGIVLDITDDTVKMDFNHPLAGDDLYFSGAVKEVREATDEEMMAAVGGGGCGSGCGCGSGEQAGCDSGSCGSDGSGSGGCGCS
ncbi:FKBP-type peptidyl-prolyl cis-trans isomerase [Saccharicrinis fermentans]|uniref:Peptidyl-prolyl cis-trans isomerase n=1 Tax=Saccharicrinis fermentans DSM 9555 = JCM 21142 TaxID=869213 RepID=W7YAF5_9BACT|nr:FKBP-type peptidyl-prolyl cis-trans isomerase [Saccharicrinis fermentans]GAF04548.1 FKBP-type peptidyl-prolyl cis-trans isomerase SlyD [Saccharicrinis fermentans DSM 9555 = JCM 21142]